MSFSCLKEKNVLSYYDVHNIFNNNRAEVTSAKWQSGFTGTCMVVAVLQFIV